ncbi:hypothetical protein DYB37_004711 [Aphanomyces astaci]|uniref:Glycine transporter domain-containing protein n=1 Tax=Aphanomyces astaci TaxID=112090 RepID=A0A397F9B6_APHAT|nr:hypothetical protein DYB36_009913 [Aphanomyces astaci]RHY38444.1 hypothetical protein DYB25_008689 [Aphanomyces astaci]RHY84756.1 hypothetical protein DYB35_014114 [Aphanomyces astaci]RHY93117.1 hypothetical protein DYB26_006599 [Aphanomyces astaci]RHZ13962.1 hypothetical protein DYB31_010401 [Aphanomyces astaci]
MLAHIRPSVETTGPLTPDVHWCELSPAELKTLHPEPPHVVPNKQHTPYEGLPRWPGLSSATAVLRILDIIGTSFFAASGSLAAAMSGCDLVGCIIVGCITAVGGGTWRDILLLHKQPFWVQEWEYLVLAVAVSVLLFLTWGLLPLGQTVLGATLKAANGDAGVLMDWGDALGIGAASVIGAMNGIRSDCPVVISALCGMVTATCGGFTRDVVLNRTVRILYSHAEVYAVITLTGAAAYLSLQRLLPKHQALRIAFCVLLVIVLRQQAWTHGWRMPTWNTHKPSL